MRVTRLERMRQLPPREPGQRLRPSDEARILDLAADGWTQERIATEIGCHQSTVSRTLAEYGDSRPLARKLLNARALDMAKRFVTDATPRDVLRMMGKLDVVRDDASPGSVGVTVVVGLPSQPAWAAGNITLEGAVRTVASSESD